ncbi:hypothetical protein RhiirA1_455132 [Rhizophagus irregularis]|uniref:Uncharacterized protein n=1 Tax=Rhizophagus irregularis TaxID=588596 RepID=A0A2N0S3M2_9GLOM|nr:hypothetical protein RhiirA1_455132 [Rhizophagus irregularis]
MPIINYWYHEKRIQYNYEFFPKNPSVPKWIPGFTGKFFLNEEPPHDDSLEIIFNLLFM